MTSYKISELNSSSVTQLQPDSLTVVIESGTTKKIELSGVWEACLDGSLNTNNTAVFKQNVTVNNDLSVNGDSELNSIILTSPNGSKYKIFVDNTGNLSTSAV